MITHLSPSSRSRAAARSLLSALTSSPRAPICALTASTDSVAVDCSRWTARSLIAEAAACESENTSQLRRSGGVQQVPRTLAALPIPTPSEWALSSWDGFSQSEQKMPTSPLSPILSPLAQGHSPATSPSSASQRDASTSTRVRRGAMTRAASALASASARTASSSACAALDSAAASLAWRDSTAAFAAAAAAAASARRVSACWRGAPR